MSAPTFRDFAQGGTGFQPVIELISGRMPLPRFKDKPVSLYLAPSFLQI
ncbi:MAG: hypothetical protein R3B84_15315 [Zavarzinella sp.]